MVAVAELQTTVSIATIVFVISMAMENVVQQGLRISSLVIDSKSLQSWRVFLVFEAICVSEHNMLGLCENNEPCSSWDGTRKEQLVRIITRLIG